MKQKRRLTKLDKKWLKQIARQLKHLNQKPTPLLAVLIKVKKKLVSSYSPA